MSHLRLAGARLLVLEDELLIAMDVEQLCRDHGATDVVICKNLIEALDGGANYDAAIVDVMLGGESTLSFADSLRQNGVPFIFASGYIDRDDIAAAFPDIASVGKPYSGQDLIDALTAAIGLSSGKS